jgi:hypothetical protein
MCPPPWKQGGGITNPTMSATTLNLTLEQGATFSQTIAVASDTSLDAYTARARVRRRGFRGCLVVDLTCSAILNGSLTVSLTAAQTAALIPPTWAEVDQRLIDLGVWDLELVSGSTVVRSREGVVKLSREATYD